MFAFSFYYTNLASIIIKNNDPIMKEIKRTSNNYESKYVNAVIDDNNIIPGISGVKVDIDKSYLSMKKYGAFNDSLLVFKDVIPSVSISNTYDKYISNGNDKRNNISIVFRVNNEQYIEEILNVLCLKNISAYFFVSRNVAFDKTLIQSIKNSGSYIQLLDDNYNENTLLKYNKYFIKNYDTKLKYCYLEEENSDVLNNCSKKEMYTIIPNIITNFSSYNTIKEKLKSGSIIGLKNTKQILEELKYIINYIEQKGYKIVSLDELIKE